MAFGIIHRVLMVAGRVQRTTATSSHSGCGRSESRSNRGLDLAYFLFYVAPVTHLSPIYCFDILSSYYTPRRQTQLPLWVAENFVHAVYKW